uniref:BTB/POZ domain-containing protein n=1 Tax=Rhabditophanes sp. KR3021 TaxID=114890 RepID=A0AC35U5S0_9BILA
MSSNLPSLNPGSMPTSLFGNDVLQNYGINSNAAGALNVENHTITNASIEVIIDFTRPDGQRTRPLLVDGKRLYVDEHYISVWSPVLRAWCIECPDRELILANVQYDHILEMLLAIHPTYKDIDDQTVHTLLPIAFDYQMEGLLHRCECFLVNHRLPFLEKVWLADRYKLNRLLGLLIKEMKPNNKVDLSGTRYYGLSDRVKVLLLERLHGASPPDDIPEQPLDLEKFYRVSDLNFASVRSKTGRMYYVNPYYLAAWSNIFQERILCLRAQEELYCPCSHEELKAFLMAVYPPQLRITEANIGPILVAACKMESPGLLKKCAQLLLSPATKLSVFVRLSLLDRCYLHEMLNTCLKMITRPENLIEMTQQQTYDCLSTKARAALMDRLSFLLKKSGLPSHNCLRCKTVSSCNEVTWMCPQCKTYSSDFSSTVASRPSNQALTQQGKAMPMDQQTVGSIGQQGNQNMNLHYGNNMALQNVPGTSSIPQGSHTTYSSGTIMRQ